MDAEKVVTSDVQASFDLAKDTYVGSPIEGPDGRQYLPVSNGLSLREIPALNPILPDDVAESVIYVEPASLVDYVNRFKTTTAICTASLNGLTFTAQLDYYGPSEVTGRAEPRRNQHVARLRTPYDIDYAKWREKFGVALDQASYADFIEDMLHTIGSPPGAELLDAIMDLRVHREVVFKSALNQRDGAVKLQYEEEDGKQGGTMTLPQEIVLVLPVFQGGAPVQITTKLRYRMKGGVLSFIIAAPGIEKLERDEFRKIGDDIAEQCGIPVYYGA